MRALNAILVAAGKEKKNGPDLYFIVFHIIAPVSIFFLAVFLFVYYALYRRARKNLKYQKQNCNVELKMFFIL
jgi:heme/copper-type cytochrome/quinol oxidase subunit 2